MTNDVNFEAFDIEELWQHFKDKSGDDAVLDMYNYLAVRSVTEIEQGLSAGKRIPTEKSKFNLAVYYTEMQARIHTAETDAEKDTARAIASEKIEQAIKDYAFSLKKRQSES